jgi:putative ABC transport system substrate-binding protein
MSLVGVIWNPNNVAAATEWKETQGAARTLNIKLESVEVRRAEDLVAALPRIARRQSAAVVMIQDTLTYAYRNILAEFAVKNRIPAIMAGQALPPLSRATELPKLALQHRLPSISQSPRFAEWGGLLQYGADILDLFRRSATQVDKILKGAKPADLPVEQPTKITLIVNRKTAKALDLTIPQTLLLRADQVID